MIDESILQNNVYIMKEAVEILNHHFTFVSQDEEASEYGHRRLSYLKSGIERYDESGGEENHVTSSLFSLFSALYHEKSESLNGVVWSDIRDELSRIVIDG